MDCISEVWLQHFNQIGLPVVLLLGMFYSIYLVARWIAPRIDEWLKEYFAIQIKKAQILEEASSKCAELQALNVEAIRELTHLIRSMESK